MPSENCPPWNYNDVPAHSRVIREKIKELLIELNSSAFDRVQASCDTRPMHNRVFSTLTPDGFEYYAGNYRGSAFRCLSQYRVRVPSDPRVGYEPYLVTSAMDQIRTRITTGIRMLIQRRRERSDESFLLDITFFVCDVFVRFLTIHPYADGNGHAGRYMIWALYLFFGFVPRHFFIDPRPPDPPYSMLIRKYRDGDKNPLAEFMLGTMHR